MKYIIIDDKKEFAELLCNKLNGYHNCNNKCLKFSYTIAPDKLVADIKKRTEKEPDRVILINVNLNVGNNTRQQQKGIKLLKLLRLEGFNSHCILYSFQDFLHILKSNPLNSIIHSKGVSFIQLPFLTTEVLSIKTSELAIKENLLPFFRAEVDLVGIRHELANLYGLQKVLQFHNKICKSFKPTTRLSDGNKYTYKLIEYLQGSIKQQSTFNLKTADVESLTFKLREILKFSARVLYLDDQANIGWLDFLKSIIGNGLSIIEFEKNDNEVTIFKKYKSLEDRQPLNLFICDLRLKPEEENVLDFRELISYKLIKKIRAANPKQKVMYFSATNDLNKYKSLLGGEKGSPDRYKPQYIFTKEGIDQHYTEEQSFFNYKNLITFFGNVFQAEMSLNKVQSLFLFDMLKAEQIQRIDAEISKLKLENGISDAGFENFDLIVFDTNAFYNPEMSIKILKYVHNYSGKSCIHLSVFAEMKNYSNIHRDKADKEVQWLLATKCVEYFEQSKYHFSEECMSDYDKEKARKLDFGKDFADEFLIDLCKKKSETANVLFVSNDRAEGERKQRGEADGPATQLIKWVNENNITTLSISTVNNFYSKLNTTKAHSFPIKKSTPSHQSGLKEQSNKKQELEKPGEYSKTIKWSDCNFNEENRTLQFSLNGQNKVVTIGNNKISDFKKVFQKLKETDATFEIEENKFGFFSIWGLSKIIINSLR